MAAAFRNSPDHVEFLGNVDRTVMAPLRETLTDGKEAGDLDIADVELTAAAMMGALHQAALTRLIFTGSIDPDEIARVVVPLLIDGLRPR